MKSAETNQTDQSLSINRNARDNNFRHSLQPKAQEPPSPLRHTKSHTFERRLKMKSPSQLPPSIPEGDLNEESDVFELVNEKKKEASISKLNESDRGSRTSISSKKSISSIKKNMTNGGYDNPAFEGSRSSMMSNGPLSSRATLVTDSTRSSVRDPSVQSLTVIREQYCCCSTWSSCEKILLAAVAVLAVIILVLAALVGYFAVGSRVETTFNWSL